MAINKPFITTSVNTMTLTRISHIIQELNDVLNENSIISVSDFYKIIGKQSEDPCLTKYGWESLDGMAINFNFNVYTLNLPEPVEIEEVFDPSKYEIIFKIKGDCWCELEIGRKMGHLKASESRLALTSDDLTKALIYARRRITKECEKRNL